jgi:Xaa-Pro aminopeptidase
LGKGRATPTAHDPGDRIEEIAMSEELNRTCDALRRAGADLAVLASVANVTYATGVEVPIPYGAMAELTYAPWLAVISAREGTGWAVVPNYAAARFEGDASDFEPLAFDTFDTFTATDPRGTYLAQVEAALRAAGISASAIVAVESRAVPAMVQTLIADRWPGASIAEAEQPLVAARWIKTPREIERLRRASHLSDVGHTTLSDLCCEAGRNEIDMWGAIAGAIYHDVGREIVLSGELVTGPRATMVAYPNGPHDRVTEPGEAALMDLSGRIDGYWFDCTNTHVIGGVEPTAEQRRYARASQDACEAAMTALRPGAKASDASAAAEQAFAKYGLPMAHYAGHQIGVTVNELPRLVPYDHSVIEAGMVFSVEPGAYMGPGGDFGARSEKMVLVRKDGPEILSTFPWGID